MTRRLRGWEAGDSRRTPRGGDGRVRSTLAENGSRVVRERERSRYTQFFFGKYHPLASGPAPRFHGRLRKCVLSRVYCL